MRKDKVKTNEKKRKESTPVVKDRFSVSSTLVSILLYWGQSILPLAVAHWLYFRLGMTLQEAQPGCKVTASMEPWQTKKRDMLM